MNGFLFPPSGNWYATKDGDPIARGIFHRHYSFRPYADGRDPKLFCGPGEKLVLLTPSHDAMFVWRKFVDDSGQTGINCAVFRNESSIPSSQLIREADAIAWQRWPDEPRHYTYVNSKKIRSDNPGCCFKKAGWRTCGMTKWNKLHILEIERAERDEEDSK